MRYEFSTDIDTDAATVWKVLADVERWPEWTPSTTAVRILGGGEVGAGSRAEVRQPRLPRAVWEVTEFEPEREFTWRTSNGGVTTVAEHLIADRAEGGVSVCLRLTQTGPLAPLVGLFVSGMTRRYVQAEANGLKSRCEADRRP